MSSREAKWFMIGTLVAYFGYYCTRSTMITLFPTLVSISQLNSQDIGTMTTGGYVLQVIGKIINGLLVQKVGGRVLFYVYLVLLALIQCLFVWVEPDLWKWTVIYSVGRFLQSRAWSSLLHQIGEWIPREWTGRALGWVSMTYGASDVLVRVMVGAAVSVWSWKMIVICMSLLALIVGLFGWCVTVRLPLPNLYQDIQLKQGTTKPTTEQQCDTSVLKSAPLTETPSFTSLFKWPSFWGMSLLYICLCLLRETWLTWASLWLKNVLQLSPSTAGMMSAIYPLSTSFAAWLSGRWWDRWSLERRHAFQSVSLIGLVLVLVGMLFVTLSPPSDAWYLGCMGMAGIAWLLEMPAMYIEGYRTIEWSQRHGYTSAVTAGVMQAMGNMGAIMSGVGVGYVQDVYGWAWTIIGMIMMASIAVFASLLCFWLDRREKSVE